MTSIAGLNPNPTLGCRNVLDSNILSILGLLATAVPSTTSIVINNTLRTKQSCSRAVFPSCPALHEGPRWRWWKHGAHSSWRQQPHSVPIARNQAAPCGAGLRSGACHTQASRRALVLPQPPDGHHLLLHSAPSH